jgi:5-(carboxyamino)imidazole ribonucleotide synthase
MKVGILGGGQLARMLALAGLPLGIDCVCLTEQLHCSAAASSELLLGELTNPSDLAKLVAQVDVLTFENENIELDALAAYQDKISPPLQALKIAQDRLLEKRCFNELGINTTDFYAVASRDELEHALQQTGYPAIVKTRRLGYDGKGQYLLRTPQDIELAWQQLAGQDLLLENCVPFDYEVSQIAVRDRQGNIAYYPLSQNTHQAGILRHSIAPFNDHAVLTQTAQRYSQMLLEKCNYVGILAIEFFVCRGQLIANEFAPRVHNSGHWTSNGASCSQFENHLRAICGLPLGQTQAQGNSAMVNCIGSEPALEAILAIAHTHYHHYGKQPRPGRKLAHININCTDANQRDQLLAQVQSNLQQTD